MQTDERLQRQEADAYRFNLVRRLLIEYGCPWPEGCHIPTTVNSWLQSLGCTEQSQRDLAPVETTAPPDVADDEDGEEIDFLLGELSVLDLRPGDTIVAMYQDTLSAGQKAYLASRWEDRFPGHRVLVLDAGTTLGVIRQAGGETAGGG